MNQLDRYFKKLLKVKTSGNIGLEIPDLSQEIAAKLENRIKNINLYLHSYTFYKNFYYGKFTIIDFLDFAYLHNFSGIAINIGTGEDRSLDRKTDEEIKRIGDYAKAHNLVVNIDTSSTDIEEFKRAVHISNILESKNIRFYIRNSGLVSEIMDKAVTDIKAMVQIAKDNNIHLLLEQHEDLKSAELVRIILKVNDDNLKLMFDYGNMINAYEKPLEALQIMAPHIKHVHMKGVKIIKEGDGFGHIGVCEKNDDLPQAKLMFDLLMLGDKKSQIDAFYLEEVNDYYAPSYRFKDEDENATIPPRTFSITKRDDSIPLKQELKQEIKNACAQMDFVRSVLMELVTIAKIKLNT